MASSHPSGLALRVAAARAVCFVARARRPFQGRSPQRLKPAASGCRRGGALLPPRSQRSPSLLAAQRHRAAAPLPQWRLPLPPWSRQSRRSQRGSCLILLEALNQHLEDLLVLRKPPRRLLAEDELLSSGDLEDAAPPLDQLRAGLELLLDGVGQTDRARLVVSLNAVLDRHVDFGFHGCSFPGSCINAPGPLRSRPGPVGPSPGARRSPSWPRFPS